MPHTVEEMQFTNFEENSQAQMLQENNSGNNSPENITFLKQDPKTGADVPKKAESQPSLFILFYFTNKTDKILMGFAFLFSVCQGIILPFIAFTTGDLTNALVQNNMDKIVSSISDKFLIMIYVGISIFVAGYIAALFWNILSARQTQTVKKLYFRKLLILNIPWFDKRILNELPSDFSTNVDNFTSSLSIKMHLFIMHFAIVFGGILISFIKGYLLTLILLGLTPLMFILMYFFILFIQKTEKYQKQHYAKAASISNEVFTYIKTVKSLNGEEHEIKRYSEECRVSQKHAIKYGYIAGSLFGATFFSIYLVYAFAFYIATHMIKNQWFNSNTGTPYQTGDLLTIFFSNLISIFALGQISPLYKNLESGKNAVQSIIKTIKTPTEEPRGGIKTEKINGRLEFRNVSFSYPDSPEKRILENLSFIIEPGQKIAFVGPSGCGKSTIIQLIERFYQPTEGEILLDGVAIESYDLSALRNRIGYVFQQPILFAKSIGYNVCLGSMQNEKVTREQIWENLEKVHAKSFVEALTNQLDYYVGNLGSHLSGGQKQRIAIARVLTKKPDFWIFDEATSALDSENEALIQNTIDQITSNATSISIAHRLSTIENSDRIFVMKEGKIIEQGTHAQLLQKEKGLYYGLHELQSTKTINQSNYDSFAQRSFRESVAPSQNEKSKGIFPQTENERIQTSEENEKKDKNEVIILNGTKDQKETVKLEKGKASSKNKIKLMTFLGNEKWLILLGFLASILNGAVMPIIGFILGSALNYFQQLQLIEQGFPVVDDQTTEVITQNLYKIIIAAVGVSVGSLIFNSLQYGLFNHAGEKFTYNLRSKYFRKLVYQDMEFYDEIRHQPNDLSYQLSDECKTVNSLIGSFIGSIVQSLSSFGVGLAIAFVYSWRITLVLIGLSPIIFLSGVMEALLLHQVKSNKKQEEFKLVGETLENIKVVKSLTAENEILEEFDAECKQQKKKMLRLALLTSATIGYAQGSMFFVFAIVFRIGAVFLKQNVMDKGSFLITIFSIIIGLFGAGMAAQFIGTLGPAQAASKIILKQLNRKTYIEQDPSGLFLSENNEKKLKPEFFGEIEFQDIYFKHKTQKQHIFKKLNLTIKPGQSIAFAGGSGAGKSTLFQLLLRFYTPKRGKILIDGHDIRDFDLNHLRSIFGVVRQEPALFGGSISYNLVYNLPSVTKEAMITACDQANASEFIFLDKKELERDVGNFGSNLSGGQKQRISIARVLLRNCHILLLDEATSALDSQSEMLVQNAIEKIKEQHTTISIAHRVSTIKNADVIFVFDEGKVVERGSYNELLMLNGKFVELARLN